VCLPMKRPSSLTKASGKAVTMVCVSDRFDLWFNNGLRGFVDEMACSLTHHQIVSAQNTNASVIYYDVDLLLI
jgi:hypothetical protein